MQMESTVAPTSATYAHNRFPLSCLRIAVLICVLAGAGVYEIMHLSAFFSDSMWGHLRIGTWILDNHSVPRTGVFSQLSGAPWVDSSWGFDLLVGIANRWLGLRALPMLLGCLKVALAWVIFRLASGSSNFLIAAVLSVAAQCAMVGLQPDPACFSVIFFGLELMLLLQWKRSGGRKLLFLFPLLFVVWANLHIEFVDGLLLLALFTLALFLETSLQRAGVSWFASGIESRPSPSPAQAAMAIVLSVTATLLTPYSFHLLGQVLREPYTAAAFRYSADMRAMPFRQPQHYLLVLLVMGAYFALGRLRSRDLFKYFLLIATSLIAFRIQRDAWCAVLATTVVLADALGSGRSYSGNKLPGRWELGVAAALGVAAIAVAGVFVPNNASVVMERVENTFPVRACEFIRANSLPGPLFNAYRWGGFLAWYMPEYPVAIDERVGLYGDEFVTQHFQTVSGNQLLELNPSFAGAGTVLLERQSGIARALTNIPMLTARYRVLYSDDVAIILQRK